MMKNIKAFTLIEVLIGTAVFVIIATAAYGAYASIFRLAALNQTKLLAVQLADERFEIARNMTYDDIGLQGGVPAGTLPPSVQIVRGGIPFTVDTVVRNIDLPSDGTIGGTPNDLTPADNKLVQITVGCATCHDFAPVVVTGQIAPKNVEAVSTNGSLRIQVFDASGVGVPNASVRVEYATTTPIVINDTTDNDGILQIIDLPPATHAYSITVTKNGYSSDRTHSSTPENPTPLKPLATVASQQLTQISFIIDKVSTLLIDSVTASCQTVPNFNLHLTGTRLIGPEVPKYSQDLTTGGTGSLILNQFEWGSYTLTVNDTAYDLAGINPLNPISINPDSSQSVELVVVPHNPKSLLVTVKDGASGLPLSDATVRLKTFGGGDYDVVKTTGRGHLSQVDWSRGSGQAMFVDSSKYWSDDGGVDPTIVPGNLTLRKIFEDYAPNGMLESSTFDTGTTSNFYSLSWNPAIQLPATGVESVRMQLATSPSSTPDVWNFIGPDGTSGTYYTSPDSSINSIHNGNRYLRYRTLLSTATATATPIISNISFTYTSSCLPPGQVIFSGLSTGPYTLEVSKDGYTTFTRDIYIEDPWYEVQVPLGS